MTELKNENLLKLIFSALALFKIRQLFIQLRNKILNKILLSALNYKAIYNSMGKAIVELNKKNKKHNKIDIVAFKNQLITTCDDFLKVWNVNDFSYKQYFKDQLFIFNSLIINPKGIIAASSYPLFRQNIIKLWDIKDNFKCIRTIQCEDLKQIFFLSYNYLAYITDSYYSNIITILNYINGKPIKTLNSDRFANTPAILSISQKLFIMSTEKQIKFFNIEKDCKCVGNIKLNATILCRAYMRKEKALLTGCSDKSIRILKLVESKSFISNGAHQNDITCIIPLAYGYFASSSKDSLIKIWDIQYCRCFKILEGHKNPICSIVKLTDKRIVSVSHDQNIIVWSY
jgi:WD40 repeat protein